MNQQDKPALTQRAYTLRLTGADPNDQSWRNALWQTHEAVNKGAKAFGDWLLTLRGGLDHNLADAKVKDRKGKLERDPTSEERKARRILLALSWLSVESELGAPKEYIVASGKEPAEERKKKVLAALEEIIKSRTLAENEVGEWKSDCAEALSAAIRADAVWVNRSKKFDGLCNGQEKNKARNDAQIILWYLLTDDYLSLPRKAEKGEKGKKVVDVGNEQDDSEDYIEEEKLNDVIQSGKGAGHRTRHLFSHIFGFKDNPTGFGKGKQKLGLKDFWKDILKPCLKESGIPLLDTKHTKKNSNGRAPTELQREMFSQAASRLAQFHTKQRQQEVEREKRKSADNELRRLENDPTYNDALNKLKDCCEWFEESSGSLRGFQIEPRHVTKWEDVVEEWAKIAETDTDKAEERRVEGAKRLQEELSEEKFGYINLFKHLAKEEYKPVWWHHNKADASILKTFVRGMKARADAEFLKVASYRHPDPYFHPVFCKFGDSRPAIKFNRLDSSPSEDVRIVRMLTWDGQKAEMYPYWAVSKHFDGDIGSRCESTHEGLSKLLVPRRDRLSLSAVFGVKDKLCTANVFDKKEVKRRIKGVGAEETDTGKNKEKEPEWNGTLYTDRLELEKIGKLIKTNKTKADDLIKKLKWSVIVSMELQPQGPWIDYGRKHNLLQTRKSEGKIVISPLNAKDGWRGLAYPIWHPDNVKGRKGMAKHLLSRFPALRILSVDLGLHYAAACTVWVTLTSDEVKEACGKAGCNEPTAADLYLHIKSKVQNGNDKTTIYRRIAADTLPDGTPHPAPWARLDRQFLIKLQGEKKGVRKAYNEEIWAVHRLESELGRTVPLIDRLVKAGWAGTEKQKTRLEALKQLGWSPMGEGKLESNESLYDMEGDRYKIPRAVDELMSSAVRTMRLALNRHGDRARIAHYLITDEKTKPGGIKEKLDENGRIELLQDALVLWHGLFSSPGWQDEAARKLWDEHVAKLNGYKAPEGIGEESSGSKHRKTQKANREKLYDVAQVLAQSETLRKTLHAAWKKRWEEDDERWKRQLRWFKDWVLPRGKAADSPAIRKVGGLSLSRLATLTEFRRKVQVGFFTRLRPDGTKTEIKEQFGRKALDSLENLREQRVKQLASRIAEAALGIGSESPKHWEGGKRPCRRIEDPRFAPCHAIVIEDLTHYRPDETRTRRENSQLMTWSSSKMSNKSYFATK